MRFPKSLLTVATIAVCAVASMLATPVTLAAPSIVISNGHIDAFQPVLEGDSLVLYLHDGTVSPSQSRNPADVLMVANPASRLAVPDNSAYSFLGTPGSDVWILPQTAKSGVLWPGLSTEELAGEWAGSGIELRLLSASTPAGGKFFLYEIGSLLEINMFWRSDNIGASSFSVPSGLHAHMNWAFTAPGTYTLQVEACGDHVGLGRLCSGARTYTIEVQGEVQSEVPATPPPATAAASDGSAAPTHTPVPAANAAGSPAGPSVNVNAIVPPATGSGGLLRR